VELAGLQVRRLQDVKFEQLQKKDRQLGQKDQELWQKSQELELKVQKIQELQGELHEKNWVIEQLQLHKGGVYTYKVSGPGLQCATANTATHFSVEVMDTDGRPIHSEQLVTAELTPKGGTKASKAKVVKKTPSSYEVLYTPQLRGCYTLHVRVIGTEIQDSPFMVVVYPDPTQLHKPVRVIEGVTRPVGVALNCHGEMYVTENSHGQVAMFDSSGERISTIGSEGYGPGQFKAPYYVAIDCNDNIYVTSRHKLQKFNRNGEFIKSVGSGREGSKPGEFKIPQGVKVHDNQVYVCDFQNNRIQVFDLELSFITSFGTKGSKQGQHNSLSDLAFDRQGNIYVCEYSNSQVQVLDSSGYHIQQFGHESGPGKLNRPEGIHIAHECAYVLDCENDRIAVFQLSGAFLTSVGKEGKEIGEFNSPKGIMFDCNGFLYVCDWWNDRVQVF